VRGRIEAVLDWAKARGYREGENPARWRGHLDKLLPSRRKVRRVRNHPAMPYADLPQFMSDLRTRASVSARALEFAILTAGRTGEVIGARWSEIDLQNAIWTVPADRMKGVKEHRVPLSPAVVDLLKALPRSGEFVFIGGRAGKPLSNMALLELMRGMAAGYVPHGFRSTFRDWAAETTAYPSEVVEMALAHAIESKVEAAYRRGNLFDKRQRLMVDWASYCTLD
jgi:integrase